MRGPDVLDKSRVGGTDLRDLSTALSPEPAGSGTGPITTPTCTVHQENGIIIRKLILLHYYENQNNETP